VVDLGGVQRAVDRRFNRARYDADETVAAFAARLKDAVDLDTVQADLASAVQQALEPARVSVWISRAGSLWTEMAVGTALNDHVRRVLADPGAGLGRAADGGVRSPRG